MSKKRIGLRQLKLLFVKLVLSLFLLSVAWVLLYKWVDPPATLHMVKRRAEAGKADKNEPTIKQTSVSLDEMSDQLPLAVVASEDQLFLQHSGFDMDAIMDAFKRNQKGGNIRGGSTISQQVAKNVFLWHGRSYLRKAVEAYFTVLIELIWGKERIMEVYLNIAEMGDGVFGVEAASQLYFKKSAKDIGRQQAALLAAVLPNPIKYSAKNPSGFVLRKRGRIARAMGRLGGTTYIKTILPGYEETK
ncbi:monofunctional biosynthetic peptidoglycan transglycosylase [Pontibacter sp. BT310]|uniref:Biosynthetic peptidoglycan transglycosylase n=1 Tax=Pontibacter populi TaxID=890055 RepID=A0ABS6XAZ9_9BACT|nr:MULTISPECIES: monofunctional biosynthetic peptidoglycan transglycosylase [Pontibacter]MBJ6117971.1 monofunctional biosynthetic peptidoglycan transglycosylase [Pontibacter sp. BT310]MBR0570398.1 monofunctional biosynthetic peptidoglycan transglycosylase [Microvirga sp. STS03]MBW3364824.1 monofunctional biosynthetic peptidoglycan transglycosylase [Pontibacter populi]